MDTVRIIVAIDGHASTGKSTLARALAYKLGYIYVDTGAMYRALTLWALQQGFVQQGQLDSAALVASLPQVHIAFEQADDGSPEVTLNGTNVAHAIREMDVAQWVSPVATIGPVRHHLVAMQRAMGHLKGIVLDGRDIGTVVFPKAELKIFMTASPEVRAQRRFDEMRLKGLQVQYEDVLRNVIERDHMDETRDESPLRRADDALLLDNGALSRKAQLEWAYAQAQSCIAAQTQS